MIIGELINGILYRINAIIKKLSNLPNWNGRFCELLEKIV